VSLNCEIIKVGDVIGEEEDDDDERIKTHLQVK
jgi:hypothetical protein